MPAARIRIQFEQMETAAKALQKENQSIRQTLARLKQKKGVLENGDWIGTGADKFYRDMDGTILPSLQRLAAALEASCQAASKIAQILHQAEEDAAAIMRRREMVGAGAGSAPSSISGLVLKAVLGAAPAEANLPGPGSVLGQRSALQLPPEALGAFLREHPGKVKVASVWSGPERDQETVHLSVAGLDGEISFVRPRPRTPREAKVQDLIDHAHMYPTPENFQHAMDEAVKQYGIDVAAVQGKPTFEPRLALSQHLDNPDDPQAPKTVFGFTTPARDMSIGPEAFKSPGFLASVIRHEFYHAEHELDHWAIDDPQGRDKLHVQVYDSQLAHAEQDGLRENELKIFQDSRSHYYNQLTEANRKLVDSGVYSNR